MEGSSSGAKMCLHKATPFLHFRVVALPVRLHVNGLFECHGQINYPLRVPMITV